ncbi:MAG: esterase/lipase family protein [Phycisphaerales bacterium]
MAEHRRAKLHNLKARVAGAAAGLAHPSLTHLYGQAASQDASTRNPVIVLPGIMGSSIVAPGTDRVLWGGPERTAFADPRDAEQLRQVAHPLALGRPLHEATDETRITGSVYRLRAKLFGLPLSVQAYGPILAMLGVGGFLNEEKRGKSLSDHYGQRSVATSFEFSYDWRRSIAENAARLGRFIEQVREFAAYDAGLGGKDEVKVDIVAHSMGGLLVRYFLAYGVRDLHEIGDAPEPDWSGAEAIEHAIIVGTPNAGSMLAMEKLLGGLPASPATPAYPPAVLCTMPSIYQLLPRVRHEPFVEADGETPIEDFMSVDAWERRGWGLLSEASDEVIALMYPELGARSKRRDAAYEHTALALDAAFRLHRALDLPRRAPDTVVQHLFAGDGVMTPARASIDTSGRVQPVRYDYGDGTVLRSSAIMDERGWRRREPRVLTPIDWDNITFVPADHMMLTRHPTFVNNALYTLLEKPRPDCAYRSEACIEHTDGD